VQTACVAQREGRPADYPVKTRRLKRGRRSHALLWLRWRDQVLMVQRPEPGVWAGLYSLPEWDEPETLQALSTGWPGQGETLPVIQHALTHFDWTLRPLRWTLPARTPAAQRADIESAVVPIGAPGRWFTLDEAATMGLPAPIRKLLTR
jgi:A/G-specific adenine glycosylase